MPTFKVQLYHEYNKEPRIFTIEADRIEVFRSGALGLIRGRDHNGHDHLLHVFADTQWEEAWEEGQQELAEPQS